LAAQQGGPMELQVRYDVPGRSLAANVPPQFCDYLKAKNIQCHVKTILTFHQDDEFHPFQDFGCAIWSDSPRLRFALDDTILEEILGGQKSVVVHNNIQLCKNSRVVIEKACERAHARTASCQSPPLPKLIKLIAADFQHALIR
jgi:hypothetical protein